MFSVIFEAFSSEHISLVQIKHISLNQLLFDFTFLFDSIMLKNNNVLSSAKISKIFYSIQCFYNFDLNWLTKR